MEGAASVGGSVDLVNPWPSGTSPVCNNRNTSHTCSSNYRNSRHYSIAPSISNLDSALSLRPLCRPKCSWPFESSGKLLCIRDLPTSGVNSVLDDLQNGQSERCLPTLHILRRFCSQLIRPALSMWPVQIHRCSALQILQL